jgi:ABC-type antimicrobial peptide transport system permease subunit
MKKLLFAACAALVMAGMLFVSCKKKIVNNNYNESVCPTIGISFTVDSNSNIMVDSCSYDATIFILSDENIKKINEDGIYKLKALRPSIFDKNHIAYFISFIVLMAISFIYIYFSTRAQMLKDIYNIGVLRSIGYSKNKVRLSYIRRAFVQTTFTQILAYLLTMIIYYAIYLKISSFDKDYMVFSYPIFFIGIILIYIISIFISLIPINNLLRHTPAEINSRYDI